eukprot:383280-Alexandrium_andersonii.AAC.1
MLAAAVAASAAMGVERNARGRLSSVSAALAKAKGRDVTASSDLAAELAEMRSLVTSVQVEIGRTSPVPPALGEEVA